MRARNPQIAKIPILRKGVYLRAPKCRLKTLPEFVALAGLTVQLRTGVLQFASRLGMKLPLPLEVAGDLTVR